MIDTLGTLCLIWLVLWVMLTLILRAFYPLLRPTLLRLHPKHGSILLLLLWSAPLLLSLMTTLLLLMPAFNGLLLDPHCHGDCVHHVPTTNTGLLAWSGFGLAVLVALGLSLHFITGLRFGVRLRKQFEALSSRCEGYRLLNASEPAVFTLGWWRPRVFVSKGLLDGCSAEELTIILAHEEAHRLRRDNLRLLLGRVFCLVLPRAWRRLVLHDLHLLCEQSCDFAAANRYGSLSVAQTLVQVGRILRRSLVPLQGVAFDGSDLQDRVHALLGLDGRRLLTGGQVAMLLVAACLAVLLAVEPLHHGAEWLIGVLDSNVISQAR
ncbi:MAG: M56 family metallopeptidase [Pseudohongiella sp.]